MNVLKVVLLLAFASLAHAQPYVGGAIGYSKAYFPPSDNEGCSSCQTSYEVHTAAPQAKAFAGYRRNAYALEVGYGSLSKYASHNKGAFPWSGPYDIRQEIDTNQLYLQAMRYVTLAPRLEAFGSLGLARVRMKNHEYGYNDPSLQFVEQLNYDTRYRPLYGLGAAYHIGDATALRFEVTHVRHVAVSHWSAEHNVTALWLGLQVNLR